MTIDLSHADAVTTAKAIRAGQISAQTVTAAALERINHSDFRLNSFTAVFPAALQAADRVDAAIARGDDPGVLAGVPFAVKNLFDVQGIPTLAGSKINADNPPAVKNATAIDRLQQAGAILVGTLNMDEYAYGFVTENAHYGTTRNPHDPTRIAGGSSGGSAAAVAGGLVPLTLGTDTNGSIRVPASLCGIFGLKPTYGRLSRAGVALLSASLDHVGCFARSVPDIATVFDALQAIDRHDPVCTPRPPAPTLPHLHTGIEGLRIAVADGYFAQGADPAVLEAIEQVAQALGATERISIPESDRARAAAFVITASESGNLHLPNLKTRPQDFDPATRDRFLAGTLIPSTWYLHAQRFRRWYRDQVRALFESIDLILAPATPCVAPAIGQTLMQINGEAVPVRSHLGMYTQPLSCIGLPVLSVPVSRSGQLPLGVQIVAAPYNEALILRAAAFLEAQGAIAATVASLQSTR